MALKPPTQEELNEAMRQLRSKQSSSQLAAPPSNSLRNVRAHIPFSQEVMRNALKVETRERYAQEKGVPTTSRRLILSVTGRERQKNKQCKISPNGLSTLEKAMMWR